MPNPNLKENKLKRFFAVPFRGIVKAISPTLYVKMQYRYITHHPCNLKNPIRYTEKLQYLRLYVYPKDPLVSQCAGRVSVREYLKKLGHEDLLVPILGIYDRFEDIDFSALPKRFVIKTTHSSQWNMLVRDKDAFDIEKARKQFAKWLKKDYGKFTMERHYSPIKPQIIIEEFLGDGITLPTEYKIHVFNGKAKNLYVVTGRGTDIRYTQLYIDWTPFDGSQFNGWKKADVCPPRPENFDEMVTIAEEISKPFPFVRADFYCVDGKIYFSEMTFTPAKGTLILDDDQTDFEMGEWLDISPYLKK
ncbi:MAG: hypothetical protein K6E59_03075 [Bacilli bacterium]|nr:hypothetical protein [Bacilli bacterium]